ncbi:MAG: hypothetical protein PF495_01760 [Spirochaetales bacterium]|jgi:uncharacterized protein YeaC (DUF1315 family)|nr:hypothetical protein [Spirochaetales bacterium]
MSNRHKQYYPLLATVAALRLTYDDGELRIEGLDHIGSQLVELLFRDVLFTRISPEGGRLRLLLELGTAPQGLVLTDEQSELISWIQEEGLDTRDMHQAKHFIIFVGEEIVDVVSLSEPEVLRSEFN